MASYSVATGERAAHAKTLVGSTVDTVTFADPVGEVEVLSDGVAAIYFTVDGTTPTVAAATTEVLPSGTANALRVKVPATQDTVVKLISAGAPTYSVSRR